MGKIFILFIIVLNLFSKTIEFKEEKYIEALETSIDNYGYINFKKDSIEVSYKNSNEVLIFKDDILLIKNTSNIEEIDLNRDLGKKIYFLLLNCIHTNDTSKLALYFKIKKDKKETLLIPKGQIANVIKKIFFKKEKILKYLQINMQNKNRIRIEQIN